MKYLQDTMIQWGIAFMYTGSILLYTKSFLATSFALAGTAIGLFLLAIYNNWDKISKAYKEEFGNE